MAEAMELVDQSNAILEGSLEGANSTGMDEARLTTLLLLLTRQTARCELVQSAINGGEGASKAVEHLVSIAEQLAAIGIPSGWMVRAPDLAASLCKLVCFCHARCLFSHSSRTPRHSFALASRRKWHRATAKLGSTSTLTFAFNGACARRCPRARRSR